MLPADVGDESELTELLRRIRSELPPLAGVMHLAGVLDDALLPQQDLDRFRAAPRPKAIGAHLLHRLTIDDGRVNFGPWGRGGMASSPAALANLGAQGMVPLDPAAALAALGEIVRHGIGQAVVLKANWQRAAKKFGGIRPPLLDQVLPGDDSAGSEDSELIRQLRDIPLAHRVSFITEFLQREVQGFLRLAHPPAATSRLLDLGTDSLMAVELRNRLFGQFGGRFDISPTAVFEYPTIGELAEHLVSQLPDSDFPDESPQQ